MHGAFGWLCYPFYFVGEYGVIIGWRIVCGYSSFGLFDTMDKEKRATRGSISERTATEGDNLMLEHRKHR